MRITSSLVAILAASAPLPALADWEYTHWGMTPEQVAGVSEGTVTVVPPAERLTLAGVNRQNAATGSYTDGELRLTVTFQFDTASNGLICVFAAAADMSQNAAFKDWMHKKYGPPQETGGLPAIGMEELHWKTSDIIRFETMEGAVSKATQCKPGYEI